MSSALILGEPGSGVTTFVGLLYTAQVRYGTEESDEFRFHADRTSIRALMDIYGALGDGRFPEGEVDLGATPLSFVFGFHGGGRSVGFGSDRGFATVRLAVGGLTPHDLLYLKDHDTVLDETVRALLRSPILLLLVDASWLTGEVKSVAGLPMSRYDATLSGTLELLRTFLDAERDRKRRKMFPIFVVTKYDRLPADARATLGAPSTPPSTWSPSTRREFGRALLLRYLPTTAKFLGQPRHGRVEVDPPAWFFSSLGTQESPSGELRIRRRDRIPNGGWEPDYPFEEYRALLEHLRLLAHRLPRDPAEDS